MEYKTLGPNDATATLQRQVTGLFGQLTRKIGALPLKQVLAAPNPPFILGCMEGGQLLGMAGMATYQVLSGRKGWIEDVVAGALEGPWSRACWSWGRNGDWTRYCSLPGIPA